ncbi:MAG: hypothetical protein KGH63_01340 [Candidatus Micrarchaeota archaeon]|nr:hypothetical protein [Candidatus Micrarchaeota archaeon]
MIFQVFQSPGEKQRPDLKKGLGEYSQVVPKVQEASFAGDVFSTAFKFLWENKADPATAIIAASYLFVQGRKLRKQAGTAMTKGLDKPLAEFKESFTNLQDPAFISAFNEAVFQRASRTVKAPTAEDIAAEESRRRHLNEMGGNEKLSVSKVDIAKDLFKENLDAEIKKIRSAISDQAFSTIKLPTTIREWKKFKFEDAMVTSYNRALKEAGIDVKLGPAAEAEVKAACEAFGRGITSYLQENKSAANLWWEAFKDDFKAREGFQAKALRGAFVIASLAVIGMDVAQWTVEGVGSVFKPRQDIAQSNITRQYPDTSQASKAKAFAAPQPGYVPEMQTKENLQSADAAKGVQYFINRDYMKPLSASGAQKLYVEFPAPPAGVLVYAIVEPLSGSWNDVKLKGFPMVGLNGDNRQIIYSRAEDNFAGTFIRGHTYGLDITVDLGKGAYQYDITDVTDKSKPVVVIAPTTQTIDPAVLKVMRDNQKSLVLVPAMHTAKQ